MTIDGLDGVSVLSQDLGACFNTALTTVDWLNIDVSPEATAPRGPNSQSKAWKKIEEAQE